MFYRVSVGKPKGNEPLGRPRRRRKDDIEIEIQAIGLGGGA
jgi:hypothetical protein